jgi:hypothetical protein
MTSARRRRADCDCGHKHEGPCTTPRELASQRLCEQKWPHIRSEPDSQIHVLCLCCIAPACGGAKIVWQMLKDGPTYRTPTLIGQYDAPELDADGDIERDACPTGADEGSKRFEGSPQTAGCPERMRSARVETRLAGRLAGRLCPRPPSSSLCANCAEVYAASNESRFPELASYAVHGMHARVHSRDVLEALSR